MTPLNPIHDWPYPTIEADYRNHGNPTDIWRETDVKTYDNQLGAVPPIRMEFGFFVVGECFTSDGRGSVYAVFAEYESRYFCRLDYLSKFNPAEYLKQIHDQFFQEVSK